jgi:hypothetical protein
MIATRKPRSARAKISLNGIARRISEGKDTGIPEIATVAEAHGLPTWVLCIPGFEPGPDLERRMRAVVGIVEAYIKGYAAGERAAVAI